MGGQHVLVAVARIHATRQPRGERMVALWSTVPSFPMDSSVSLSMIIGSISLIDIINNNIIILTHIHTHTHYLSLSYSFPLSHSPYPSPSPSPSLSLSLSTHTNSFIHTLTQVQAMYMHIYLQFSA